MRTLPASLLLSTIVLGGWSAGAWGQSVNPAAPQVRIPRTGGRTGPAANLPPGVIPQPTPKAPGTVTGITLGELYTDNLTLAAGDAPKQTSWITEVQPFVKAAMASPRFTGLFDYTLSGYLYAGQSQYNQVAQHLDARGELTIVPQHFFLDGNAFYGRQVINHRRPVGSGTYFLDNNRTNVAVGSLSPYWVQQLGNVGTMTLRYTHGRVVYSDRGIPEENRGLLVGIPDVTSDAGQFSVVSPQNQTFGWNVGYSEQRLEPDSGRVLRFAIAKVGASLQVRYDLRLLADGGKQSRFLRNGTVDKLGATFWDAGFEWSTARNDFKFLGGHRFYGSSYQLSWTHHAALLTTNVSYTEQPTTYNRELLGMNIGVGVLPPVRIHSRFPSLTERQPYLSKRLSASASYLMPHGRLSARVYDESRTFFFEDNRKERVADADVAWRFDLGAFTTFTPSFNWRRYEFRDGQIQYTRYAQVALVHQFDPEDFGSVKLRHDDGDARFGTLGKTREYRVNVIFVEWTHLF